MGFLDFLKSVATGETPSDPTHQGAAQQVVQRFAQNTQATASGQLMGHDVGNVPLLGGLLTAGGSNNGLSPLNLLNTAGLINEGAQKVAEVATGAGVADLDLANRIGLPGFHMTRANQGTLAQILGPKQGPGNPFERAMQVNERAQADVPGMGLVTAALNPLNFAGPAGEAGAGLRAAEHAPALLRALGGVLEAGALTGKVGILPYEAGFNLAGRGAGGLIRGIKGAAGPRIAEAAPGVASAFEGAKGAVGDAAQGGVAKLQALLEPAAPAALPAPTFSKATLKAIQQSGIDPAKLAGLDDDLARYVAENAGAGQEDGLIAALRGAAPAEATPALSAAEVPKAEPPSLAGLTPEIGTPAPPTAVTPPATGPQWQHYGPESIYPGEGVTPDLLDRFAKLRQFPNADPLDVEAEIGALRDPVTLLQQHYGDQWQNRLAALTGGKWGQPGSGARMVNGKAMLGDLDLTTALRDYLETRGGARGEEFKGALKALLPGAGTPTPAVPEAVLSALPDAPTGTPASVPPWLQQAAAARGKQPWELTQTEVTRAVPSTSGFDVPAIHYKNLPQGTQAFVMPDSGVVPLYHNTNAAPENFLKEGLKPRQYDSVYSYQAPLPDPVHRYTIEFEAQIAGPEPKMVPSGGGGTPTYAYEHPATNTYRTDYDYYGVWKGRETVPPENIKRIRDNFTGEMVYDRDLGGVTPDSISARYPDKPDRYGNMQTQFVYRDIHRDAVASALREGRPVPPHVLEDYPDLVPEPPTPPVAAATAITGTVDNMRDLILGESKRVGTQYPPLDPQFYASRANVDPAQVPALLDQLVQEGTLGRLPGGELAVKPGAKAVQAAAEIAPVPTVDEVLANVPKNRLSSMERGTGRVESWKSYDANDKAVAFHQAGILPNGDSAPAELVAKEFTDLTPQQAQQFYGDRFASPNALRKIKAYQDTLRGTVPKVREAYPMTPDPTVGVGGRPFERPAILPSLIETPEQVAARTAIETARKGRFAARLEAAKAGVPLDQLPSIEAPTFGGTKYTPITDVPLTAKAQEAAPLALSMQYGGLPEVEVARIKAQAAGQGSLLDNIPVDDWRAQAGPGAEDLLAGIEDAVSRGNVDEANYLVSTATDYGVPTSRAQAVLNAAADAGGKSAGVEAQRAAIEQSPYFQVFKYFNREGEPKRINPQTGARLTGKIHRTGDEVWNLPDSGYDEVAAAALASPEFGHNQNFGTTSDEFWRKAQAAFRQYQALKRPGAAFGGDLAAGGGGFGILPFSGGLGAANRAAGGALAGGAVGAGLGAATNEDDRLGGAAKGAALGAFAGGSLGAASPLLPPGLSAGVRRDLLAPLGAVAREGAAATRQAIATGEKNPIPSFSKALPYIRSIKKTSAMTTPRNLIGALSTTAIGEGNVPEAAANMRDIWRNLPTLLPALRAAGKDVAARDQALLAALPPRMQAYDAAGMRDLIESAGVNYERNPTDLGAANVHPLAGAMRGAGLSVATPRTLVFGPASVALGALEGASLPGRAAVQTALLTPIDQGARMAFAFPEYARALTDAAPGFFQKVRASGQALTGLGADGSFGAAAIADPTLAAEWRTIQQQAAEAGGALAKDRLGNFSDPGVSTGIINALFPGGSWNVEQAKVLMRAAARHPQLAIGLLGTIYQDYQRHLQAGDPQHAGTWRLSDKTPGFGALVRVANGGAEGDLYINPAYPVSPVGGEVLNLPREISPQLNPGMSIYDKGKTIAGALGLGINPEIDLAAYKAGQSQIAPSSQVRLAPVGAFADAMLHERGGPLWANPLGQALMPDAEQTPDLQQQIQFGRFLDPAAIRAGNELIYERTGRSSSDPANADLVAQLRDPSSDFYHEALVRGLGGKAATAALGDVVPGSPQAETATAHEGARAKFDLLMQGLPITRAQQQAIAALPNGGAILSQLRQAQIDAAKLANPVLAVQDVGSAKALGEKVLDQWKRENAGLGAFPVVYGLQAAREQERLGLVPLGTAMAQQQQYDQLRAGQVYGLPQAYPGVPQPYPDPTPLYDLMHYLNGGR